MNIRKKKSEIDRLREAFEELSRRSKELEAQSRTDDLTGQYNRRHILVELEKEVERAVRYERHLSGMMIDIDDFKSVNDRYGHLAGDQVLREIAQILEQNLRKIDILGRYGGDEFLVILPEAPPDTAKVVAERVRENVAAHSFRVEGAILHMTVSIGLISFADVQEIDQRTFIEQVDQAMLNAKHSGKNQVSIELSDLYHRSKIG